jgi:putative ABC transport system permease protein
MVFGYIIFKPVKPDEGTGKMVKIGVIMANNSDIVTKTRDGLMTELNKLGYINGKNCIILEQNAEGDIPTNQTIIDHFINEKVDVYVPISTASTQAALNKIKDKPVIFATVANPFVIGAGTSPVDHPPNVTGVYGASPIRKLLGVFKQFYPGKVRIGTIYNPAYPNTVSNLKDLKQALSGDNNIILEEVTVSNSNDVYQATLALLSRGIKAFVLVNDITVFNSFESVVRISRNNRIPIFTCDAERLKDGALIVYGFEYFVSGMQAAHLIDRVIRGESPALIPFEMYKIVTFGINYDVAGELGIRIPGSVKDSADASVIGGKLTKPAFILPVEGYPVQEK